MDWVLLMDLGGDIDLGLGLVEHSSLFRIFAPILDVKGFTFLSENREVLFCLVSTGEAEVNCIAGFPALFENVLTAMEEKWRGSSSFFSSLIFAGFPTILRFLFSRLLFIIRLGGTIGTFYMRTGTLIEAGKNV